MQLPRLHRPGRELFLCQFRSCLLHRHLGRVEPLFELKNQFVQGLQVPVYNPVAVLEQLEADMDGTENIFTYAQVELGRLNPLFRSQAFFGLLPPLVSPNRPIPVVHDPSAPPSKSRFPSGVSGISWRRAR